MTFRPTASARPEISALTSLRFFAALWVVLFHIHDIGLWRGGPAAYLAVVDLGYLGVSFFFVLSGFILVYVYAGREIPKARFWQARFARIYPAYLFSLLLTAPSLPAMLPFLRLTGGNPAIAIPAFPLLLEAWFPRDLFFWNIVAWSLSVEAFFYLVFPFALRWLVALTTGRTLRLADRNLALWIAGSWLLSLAITFTYFFTRPDGAAWPNSQDNLLYWLAVIKFNPLVRLPEFLLGMGAGLAFLRTRPQPLLADATASSSVPPHAGNRHWPVLTGFALLLLAIAFQRGIPYPVLHSGLLAPVFALLIYGFALQPAWARPLAARPLVLLGEASYSLYLLHAFPIAIMAFVFHLDRSPHLGLVIALYLVSIVLVSIGVYVGIENPLRKRLRPRHLPQPVPAVA